MSAGQRFLSSSWWKWLLLAIAWLALLVVMMAGLHALNLSLIEQAAHWQPWVQRHAFAFLGWRLLLYGGIAWGGWRLRERLLQNSEITSDTHKRLRRTLWAALLALVMLEGSLLLGQVSWGALP